MEERALDRIPMSQWNTAKNTIGKYRDKQRQYTLPEYLDLATEVITGMGYATPDKDHLKLLGLPEWVDETIQNVIEVDIDDKSDIADPKLKAKIDIYEKPFRLNNPNLCGRVFLDLINKPCDLAVYTVLCYNQTMASGKTTDLSRKDIEDLIRNAYSSRGVLRSLHNLMEAGYIETDDPKWIHHFHKVSYYLPDAQICYRSRSLSKSD